MSATTTSTTPATTGSSPNLAQQLFQGLLNIAKTEIEALTPEELKVCGPDIISFFQWLEQNPTAVGNPVAFGPKLMALKMSLLAAQSTVASDLVKSTAAQMVTLFQNMLNQVNSKAS